MNEEKDFVTPDDPDYHPLPGCGMVILLVISTIFFIASIIHALWKYT